MRGTASKYCYLWYPSPAACGPLSRWERDFLIDRPYIHSIPIPSQLDRPPPTLRGSAFIQTCVLSGIQRYHRDCESLTISPIVRCRTGSRCLHHLFRGGPCFGRTSPFRCLVAGGSGKAGRLSGTSGAVDSANYIAAQFREIGYEVQFQEFGGNRRNVIARLGAATNVIIAGAHYDGQGTGYPSASDNAAGVAVLLELGRDLISAKLPVSLMLIAFDDEEQGLNGSRYFADHPTVPLENVESAIVFDALGRRFLDLKGWTTIVLGTEYSAELASAVRKSGGKDTFNIGADLIGPRSDFAPFAARRIPFLLFSDGTYVDYHGKGDTAERIDYMRLADECKIIGAVIREVASLKMKRPTEASRFIQWMNRRRC